MLFISISCFFINLYAYQFNIKIGWFHQKTKKKTSCGLMPSVHCRTCVSEECDRPDIIYLTKIMKISPGRSTSTVLPQGQKLSIQYYFRNLTFQSKFKEKRAHINKASSAIKVSKHSYYGSLCACRGFYNRQDVKSWTLVMFFMC